MHDARHAMQSAGVNHADMPESGRPEVAIVGRSNVGKSTLINFMTGRSAAAKTSTRPGKTTTMNFHLVDDRWVLVDCPGYGCVLHDHHARRPARLE